MSHGWLKLIRQHMRHGACQAGLTCLALSITAGRATADEAVTPVAYRSTEMQVADLEARIRDLEARNQEQQMRFASLIADDKKDDKKSDKKDDKPSKGVAIGSDLKMTATYKNGLELETANKDFKIHVRGREQFDWVGYTDGSQDSLILAGGNGGRSAVDFRRLRTGVDGTIYEQIDFAVELDWVNSVNLDPNRFITATNQTVVAPNGTLVNNNPGPSTAANSVVPRNTFSNQASLTPAPTDVWFNFRELPVVGNVRVGNVKQNLGLEHQNSSRFLDFMERNLGQDAFTGTFNNGFAPGILVYNWNEAQTMTYSLGYFKYSYNVFATDAGSHGNDLDTRITWTPFYDEESHGRYMMHVGVGAAYRTLNDSTLRVRARPSLRNGISAYWPIAADTGNIFGNSQTILNPEWAMVWGRWHLQSEYYGSWLEKASFTNPNGAPANGALGTIFYNSYYVQAMYFLTGEHREYEKKAGAFGRVVPHENFHLLKGKGGPILTRGAWQVGYRYQVLDLRDKAVNGNVVTDHTLGLNHFLNPNMKIQYNLVFANAQGAAPGNAPGFGNGISNGVQWGQTGNTWGAGIRIAHDF